MSNQEFIILCLYGSAFVGMILIFFYNYMSNRKLKKQSFVPQYVDVNLPGKVFNILLKVYNYFGMVDNKSRRKRLVLSVIDKLESIRNDVGQYIRHNYDTPRVPQGELKIVIENLAVCLCSLMKKIHDENKETSLDPDYSPAVVEMMLEINQFTIVDERFENKIIDTLQRIYFSVYRDENFVSEKNREFLDDFQAGANIADFEKLKDYVSVLHKWNEIEKLRRIDRNCIMPYVSSRNLLSYAIDHYNDDGVKSIVTKIAEAIGNRKYMTICFIGLTFTQKMTESISEDTIDYLFNTKSQGSVVS